MSHGKTAVSDDRTTGDSFWTRPAVVFIAAFICCTLWGSASPSIKIGYELFSIATGDTPSRILFAGARFTIAGIMVILLGSIQNGRFLLPARESIGYIGVLAAFQTILQYIFFYMGLAHTTGVRGSIINAAGSFFSIFLAVTLFHFEKLTFRMAAGSFLGFVGVLLVVSGGNLSFLDGGVSVAGEGAMLTAAFCSAMAGCFIKLFSSKENPVTLSGWQFFIGGIVMMIMGGSLGGELSVITPSGIALLIYMAFISAGAYTLWGILLKHNPVSLITVLGFINPVMGVLLSAVFLREQREAFSLVTVAALFLVSIGIYIVNKRGYSSHH
jgi:drug/metabolite transporter (DMT)-like permease